MEKTTREQVQQQHMHVALPCLYVVTHNNFFGFCQGKKTGFFKNGFGLLIKAVSAGRAQVALSHQAIRDVVAVAVFGVASDLRAAAFGHHVRPRERLIALRATAANRRAFRSWANRH